MKSKILSLLLLVCLIQQVSAQKKRDTLDVRFGVGMSLLGTGDMRTINFENEINNKFSPYFSNSVSLNFGRSNWGVFETASFIQGNLNIYWSPFRNDKRNDFRIGTGLSFYNVSDAYMSFESYSNNQLVDRDYVFENRDSFGFNLIIENTFSVTDRFLLGLKLFSQPYLNNDINSGAMLKFGVKL